MEQYIEIKAANPDCLLFYRMGDFYELFFEDAEVASRALGIVLTKRGKHLGRDIPMCGVPVDPRRRISAPPDRARPPRRGLRADSRTRPRRGSAASKSVVRRDVVRLVTPGTLDRGHAARRAAQQLPARRSRARALVGRRRASRFALAWIDISTGEFRIAECDRAGLAAEIARLEPGEIIVSDALYGDPELAPYLRTLPAVTPLTRDVFDGATAERRLSDYFAVATTEAFGTLSRLELTAAAACVTYVERTQLGKRPPLSPPVREAPGATLSIDQATRANLELVRTLARRAARLAARRDRPHRDGGGLAAAGAAARRAADRSRRDRRAARCGRDFRRRRRRRARRSAQLLNAAPDLARALSRLVVGRGGPRDLAAIRDGIAAAAALAARLDALREARRPRSPTRRRRCARPIRRSRDELGAALADELPLFKRDGGFVRAGYDAALDEARALRDESRRVIAALQARYADETGVAR